MPVPSSYSHGAEDSTYYIFGSRSLESWFNYEASTIHFIFHPKTGLADFQVLATVPWGCVLGRCANQLRLLCVESYQEEHPSMAKLMVKNDCGKQTQQLVTVIVLVVCFQEVRDKLQTA